MLLLCPWNMCIRKAFLCIRKALYEGPIRAAPLYPKSTCCSSNQSKPLYPKNKNISKTNAFFASPDHSCSNAIKTNGFLIQCSKNTVKLMVWATLVGGQRKKHNKTTRFGIAPQQQVLKRYKNQWFFEPCFGIAPQQEVLKRNTNQWFFDPRLQKHSKTNGFSNLGRGPTQ